MLTTTARAASLLRPTWIDPEVSWSPLSLDPYCSPPLMLVKREIILKYWLSLLICVVEDALLLILFSRPAAQLSSFLPIHDTLSMNDKSSLTNLGFGTTNSLETKH
jgi:hypothetical protein